MLFGPGLHLCLLAALSFDCHPMVHLHLVCGCSELGHVVSMLFGPGPHLCLLAAFVF